MRLENRIEVLILYQVLPLFTLLWRFDVFVWESQFVSIEED
jgi:hypothetical protein